MISNSWLRKVVSTCLCVSVFAAYSMVVLAGPVRVAGDLTVSGKSLNGDAPTVTVNGQAARSGRSIFSTSTIVTPDTATAVISLGKLGTLELAPASNLVLSFDENGVTGDLTAGKLTVLGAGQPVNVKTPEGNMVKLNAGESVSAAGKAQTTRGGGSAWVIWAVIFAAAGAGIIFAAMSGNDNNAGGNPIVVSPVR